MLFRSQNKMIIKPMQRVYVKPAPNDILCGRGMHNCKHPGNTSLRGRIFRSLDDYLKCQRKSEKTAIIRKIIDEVFEGGGRFLKYNLSNRRWYDGGIAAAKIRVGVGFRDAKNPDKLRHAKQQMLASRPDDTLKDSAQEGIATINPPPTLSSSLADNFVPLRSESLAISSRPPPHQHICYSNEPHQQIPIPTVLHALSPPFRPSRYLQIPIQSSLPRRSELPPRQTAERDPLAYGGDENDKNQNGGIVTTTRYMLNAIERSLHDDPNTTAAATVAASEEDENIFYQEDALEEIEVPIQSTSSSNLCDSFITGGPLVVRRKKSSSADLEETSSKEESLFSDRALNEIFGNINEDPTILSWEHLKTD